MSSGRVRTFVAIELPEDLLTGLAGLRNKADFGDAEVRWSAPETMHLTLCFLGDVEAGQLGEVADVCRGAALAVPGGFEVSVEGVALFPSSRRPNVVAAIIAPGEELLQLQSSLERGLGEAGFRSEKRAYRPHVTVGRLRMRGDGRHRQAEELAESLGPAWEALREDADVSFQADEMVVFQSELMKGGAVHTPLARIELTGGQGD